MNTATTNVSQEPIYSTLGDDPDLQDIVEMFVEEMPERTQSFVDCLNSGNWEGLRRVAHQLKGAAGSYGFPPISEAAAKVEAAIKQGEPEQEIRRSVESLVELCRRAQAVPPASSAY